MGLRRGRLHRARLVGRRRMGLAAVGLLTSVVAIAPPPSGAEVDLGRPLVSVTEITAPGGLRIEVDDAAMITERGTVLVRTVEGDDPSAPMRWAVWRSGSLTPLAPPPDEAYVWMADMSESGLVVGTNLRCPLDFTVLFEPDCSTAYVWRDGQPTAIPAEGLNAAAVAVDDHGQVLVSRWPLIAPGEPSPDSFHGAWIWRDGRTLAPPPSETAAWSQGFDINERGQVALTVTLSSQRERSHAGIWQIGDRSGVVDLGTLPGYTAFPSDMNDRGDIVGFGRDEDEDAVERALLWRRGEVIELGTLGGQSSHAEVVNDRGVVLGQSGRADGEWHPFLWFGGRMIDLGDLGGENAAPADLNNHGQVVGFSETDDPRHVHAFLWQDGQMIDLGALVDPDASSYAYDINDRGQIVGEVGGRPVIWTVHSR